MGITGNEISAANEQRRNEELSRSSVGEVLGSGTSIASAAIALGTSLVAGGPTGIAVAGSVVGGLHIVDWFRKLGTSKVHEHLEALGQATEDALNRIEKVLREHGTSIGEIKRRLESDEFKNAMASASLQALRTTNEERLKRLALLLANGVKEDDLSAEESDDMMRAAVELTERDIVELGVFISRQSAILEQGEKSPMQWYDNVRHHWQSWTVEDGASFRNRKLSYFEVNSSRSKLAAFGFIISMPSVGTTNSPDAFPYALLPTGRKFYERLQGSEN